MSTCGPRPGRKTGPIAANMVEMKSRIAHACLLLGILCILGSCAPFGWVFYNEFLLVPDQVQRIDHEQGASSIEMTASPGTRARLGIRADIYTPSVQEDEDALDETFKPRFRFPVEYQVRDARGELILDEKTLLAWKDGGAINIHDREDIDSTGGKLSVSTRLKKFTVPADGVFNASLLIKDDEKYLAEIRSATVQLHENVIDNMRFVIMGFVAGMGGFLLMVIGFFKLIVDASRWDNPGLPEGSTEAVSAAVLQMAIMIHLTGLAGYLIPFGGLLLPLVLWLLWRKNDPFLDATGKEVVNFQLTLLIYYLISIVLIIVVIGTVLLLGVMLLQLIAIVIAAIRTSKGELFRYPLTIRFFRQA